jgi:hydrogenase maturation protease
LIRGESCLSLVFVKVPHQKKILVLGVGNLLMGDEGVGIHAITALGSNAFPANVRLLDGGTGGFHLLSLFEEHDPIIIIDATMDGKDAGTVTLTEPKFASDFPRTLSAHDIGLRDLIESAALTRELPKMFLIAISIKEIRSMVTDLSPDVAQALPKVVETVERLLKSDKTYT